MRCCGTSRPCRVPAIVGVDPRTDAAVERHSSPQEPLTALAFKIALDQGRRLTYVRLYAGSLGTWDACLQ